MMKKMLNEEECSLFLASQKDPGVLFGCGSTVGDAAGGQRSLGRGPGTTPATQPAVASVWALVLCEHRRINLECFFVFFR